MFIKINKVEALEDAPADAGDTGLAHPRGIYIYIYICICIHTCRYTCMCIYIYIYICMGSWKMTTGIHWPLNG